MKIAVVGTGYVGLVTGTCLAETGNTVTCIDIDDKKVEMMKAGLVATALLACGQLQAADQSLSKLSDQQRIQRLEGNSMPLSECRKCFESFK